jgi:hypothetical protein
MIRDGSSPNRISQTVKDLKPGGLYTVKCIAANLDRLDLEQEAGLWPAQKGTELIPSGCFRCVIPSPYRLEFGESNQQSLAYTTYSQTLFRAESTTAKLTFSDWREGKPAGPVEQRIAFNFVEVQPFFE